MSRAVDRRNRTVQAVDTRCIDNQGVHLLGFSDRDGGFAKVAAMLGMARDASSHGCMRRPSVMDFPSNTANSDRSRPDPPAIVEATYRGWL